MTIPRIIHQLWIGDKPRPSKFMQSWKDKHPDFEYIMWNEEEIKKRRNGLIRLRFKKKRIFSRTVETETAAWADWNLAVGKAARLFL